MKLLKLKLYYVNNAGDQLRQKKKLGGGGGNVLYEH